MNRSVKVSTFNLAILLYNIWRAQASSKIGNMEVGKLLSHLERDLNKECKIPLHLLESACYYSNILSEIKEFWHPQDIRFNDFVKRIERNNNLKFDNFYNCFEDNK
ncbi:MAG: hypothetical protein GTN36_02730 [Candidatus Aenigmarchaeota archaeon]|nr:hypothetical protein [Candidatus Aenigmarchaeota archaeon]